MKNGGYAIISHDDVNIFNKVDSAYNAGKPILFYDDDKTCYFIDTTKKVGNDYVLVKGGKTWTVTDNNTLSSEGSVTNPTLENIKDLDGNLRFIDIEGVNTELDGVTYLYSKCSLSGTHIMFVLNLSFEDTKSALNAGATFTLPQYIIDKIIPTYANGAIEYKSINAYNSNVTNNQSLQFVLRKIVGGIEVSQTNAVTMNDTRYCRVQFDLLIDVD